MAANNLTFEQSAAFLNDIYQQATGQKALTTINTSNFVSVAQSVLKTGYDNVISAISQVVGRTIFSVRPYTAKFSGINVSEQRFGAITRKINYIDGLMENDERLPLTDGQSVDQYKINKPKVVQTNFYGGHVYQRHITIFKDQLDVAFRSPAEFGEFISGVMQNVMDQLEQIREEESRATLANFIAGKSAGDTANAINVLQAYKDETGTELTAASMYADANYIPFAKWLYSYINTLTRFMAERSVKYHMNIDGKPLQRHTPADRMKAYMSAPVMDKIDSIALPSIFGADRLKMIDFEAVSYWQNIDDPDTVKASPVYLNKTDGSLTNGAETTVNNIVGLLFDEEALGVTRINEWQQATPMNAAGGYYNIYWHFTHRTWNDFTENGVLLYAADPE
jgi:hypothetical protein